MKNKVKAVILRIKTRDYFMFMQPSMFMQMLSKLATVLLLTISTIATTLADEITPNNAMVLRKIMQELDNNMQLTNHAITREDWDVVAKTALLIAEHPEPPFSEKLRIMMFFGRDISRLKQLDGQTHQAAKNLATEAKTGNRQNIISSFNTLEQSCTNCHQQFKNAFVKHFYKP